jgi:hypothetical protein
MAHATRGGHGLFPGLRKCPPYSYEWGTVHPGVASEGCGSRWSETDWLGARVARVGPERPG